MCCPTLNLISKLHKLTYSLPYPHFKTLWMLFVLLIIYSAIYLDIIKRNLLFFSGKCSHGGLRDKTRKMDPVGGINKDSFKSDHGTLHKKAANLAVEATMELLVDIRLAAGDRNFLRYRKNSSETFLHS